MNTNDVTGEYKRFELDMICSKVFTVNMNRFNLLYIAFFLAPTLVSSQWCDKECFDEIWLATGEVPEKLPEVPPNPLNMAFEGRMIMPNESVDTEIMLDWPKMFWYAEDDALYSIFLLDYGIPELQGGQYVHWWIANVEHGFAVEKGQEVSIKFWY